PSPAWTSPLPCIRIGGATSFSHRAGRLTPSKGAADEHEHWSPAPAEQLLEWRTGPPQSEGALVAPGRQQWLRLGRRRPAIRHEASLGQCPRLARWPRHGAAAAPRRARDEPPWPRG